MGKRGSALQPDSKKKQKKDAAPKTPPVHFTAAPTSDGIRRIFGKAPGNQRMLADLLTSPDRVSLDEVIPHTQRLAAQMKSHPNYEAFRAAASSCGSMSAADEVMAFVAWCGNNQPVLDGRLTD